jgi:DNA-binding GntR family transcriptional regulator
MKKRLIFEKLNKVESLTNNVYLAIKEAIVTTRLDPGVKLNISKIASELGTSTTPVREALNRLIKEGLVVNIPFKGLFVADVVKNEVEQLLEVRTLLELAAISKAVKNVDSDDLKLGKNLISRMKDAYRNKDVQKYIETSLDFHMLYINKCGNQMMAEFLENFTDKIKRLAFLAVKEHEKIPAFIEDYEKILSALEKRDNRKATRLLREHLKRVEGSLYLKRKKTK